MSENEKMSGRDVLNGIDDLLGKVDKTKTTVEQMETLLKIARAIASQVVR